MKIKEFYTKIIIIAGLVISYSLNLSPLNRMVANQIKDAAETKDPLYKDLFEEQPPKNYFENLNQQKNSSQFKRTETMVQAPQSGVRLYMKSLWKTLNHASTQKRYTANNIDEFVNRLNQDFSNAKIEPLVNARINTALTQDTLNEITSDILRFNEKIQVISKLKKEITDPEGIEALNQEERLLNEKLSEAQTTLTKIENIFQKELIDQEQILIKLISQKEEELSELIKQLQEEHKEAYAYIEKLRSMQKAIQQKIKEIQKNAPTINTKIIEELKEQESELELEIAMRSPAREREKRELNRYINDLKAEHSNVQKSFLRKS